MQNIICGVPQGPILGLLIFLIYTNDLHEASNISDSIMFADDTNLFYSHQNINNLFSTVNSQLECINQWFKANKLPFNRDLNRVCLVYMFSLRFSGSKFLINLRRQFRVRKIFSYTSFCGVCGLHFVFKIAIRKCVTYVLGCSFIKTCSLTGC